MNKILAVANIGGAMTSFLAWLNIVNIFLGFLGGILAVIAGGYLVAIRIYEWKHRKQRLS
jgi:hypothetical protein